MRNERGMTLATVVIMLCCMGAVSGAVPSTQSNVLISRVVVDAYPSFADEPNSEALDAPEKTTSCYVHIEVVNQIEIDELHNLPPPSCDVI